VEIFKQIDANRNGEISQIEFIQALRRDSALANRLGLPNEIRQEDESRKLFAFKYADIDKDQNKALSLGEFLAYYHKDENNLNSGDGPGSVSGARSVDMIIKLGLDFAIAGPEDSTQREAFVCDLSQDLANASRLPPASFYIKVVSPGSIIVDTEIRADAFGNAYDPGTVARDLERQANDPSSTLRGGVLTRFTQSLVLRPPQPTPLIQLSPTKSNFERPPLPMASAKPNYPGQTSAPPLLRNSFDCMPKAKSGVGLAFKMNEFGEFVVLAVRPGSSADKSVICVGNKIISVGPIPVKGIPRDTVVELIKGSPGTRVTLGILREAGSHGTENGQSDLVSVTLIRSDESSSSSVGSAEPMVTSSSASAAPMMETSKSETSKSSASAAPMMETSMMSLSESLSQTIGKPKHPFDFIGVPRTVTLQRGPGYTGNPDESTGVGISFQATKSGGYMIITKLVQNGPADSSREVSIGDAILRVNNVPVQGKRIPEVVSLIKGQPGSFVVLVLQPTSLDEVTLSHGGGSLYNSASSHMGSKVSGPGYDTIPRAPVYSGSSTTMTKSFNSRSAPSISAQRPSRPAGIRVVRLQRQHLNTGSGVSERAGIGMGFERDPAGNHTVSTLFPGGTAANSGKIYVGDRVLRVNGAAVQGLSPKVVSEMIQGPQGTDVAMTIETLETVQNETAAVTQSNVDSDELFVVALVLTAPLPCKVSGVDMLMDKTHRLQEQEGYQNESINVGDHIIAINKKILQNQTSQQLFQMLSGPLHSEVELMVQNASCNGDKLYTVNLVRNVPIAIYSHWCEQINTPTVMHPSAHLTSAHLTGPEGLVTALDDSANQPSILVEPKVEVHQTAAASNTALVPRITPPSALKLTVKVLEADGLALSEGGAVPLCVANLRLIFPDDLTESIPDVLQAMGEGQKALFGNSLHEYIAQVVVLSHMLSLHASCLIKQ
jgi:C-terminal processing protease CtpA/Prc